MVPIKTPSEIEKMKVAGMIVAKVHVAMKEAIKPGITIIELDQIAEKVIRDNNAIPSFKGLYGFPASICASLNDVVVHGIPDKTALKEGDIISIDVGAEYEGYHGDSGWTYGVGKISDEDQNLMDVTLESLMVGLRTVKPGIKISNVSNAIGKFVFKHGYSIPEEFTGHGIGKDLHEEPIIYNLGQKGHGPVLAPGMCLAIEPMVHIGTKRISIDADGWTARTADRKNAAHFEHTVLVTEKGCQLLTSLDQEELING